MPTKSVAYPVEPEATVLLNAWIGDGQAGGHAAYLGGRRIAEGEERLRDIVVGTGAELAGRVLVVSSTVVDIRPEHDNVSVRIELRGGKPDPLPIAQRKPVPAGGAMNFLTVVRFHAPV